MPQQSVPLATKLLTIAYKLEKGALKKAPFLLFIMKLNPPAFLKESWAKNFKLAHCLASFENALPSGRAERPLKVLFASFSFKKKKRKLGKEL